MQEFIVSARKYRPMTFDTVVGQSALTTTLKNAIATDKLAHAYLFCGPRGVGKTTCARIFARTINCLSPRQDGESCGECESCKAFNEGRSMNIHELDAASNNSVEDIRELIKQVQIPPQIGKYKVFIIDEVHMLSSQAFNAFLKTLEEPPSYVIFILATTEKHKILPTILSRCQVYDFARMTVENTIAHLRGVAQKEGYTTEDEALQLIAEKADGGMRDALSIFDQMVSFTGGDLTYEKVCGSLNVLSSEYYFRLVDHFLKKDVTSCMLLLNEVLGKGFDGGNFIGGLAGHFRQLLMAKDASTLPLLETSERFRQRYQQQATSCDVRFIYRALKLCNDCDQAYRQSRNKRLQVEICLIQCAQLLEEDAPGSGLCPEKKIKPIFNTDALQSETQRTEEITPRTQRHVASQLRASAPEESALPKMPKLKLANIGPRIRLTTTSAESVAQAPEAGEQATRESQPLTQEGLAREWMSLINRMPVERRAMAMRMKVMSPRVLNENTFEVVAGNPQVAQYLMNITKSIEQELGEHLHNGKIKMTVRVAEVQEVQHLVNKPQLYKKMIAENDCLRQLAELLQLELC